MSKVLFTRDGASESFRKMTSLAYGCALTNDRDSVLLFDLMKSTREIALERQNREVALESPLSSYSWLVISTYAVFIIMMLLWIWQGDGFALVSLGATIGGIVLILDLLYRLNQFYLDEISLIREKFKKNI